MQKFSEQQRVEAQNKLKLLSNERELNETIKNKIKDQGRKLQQLIESISTSDEPLEAKISMLSKLTSQTLPNAILSLETKAVQFTSIQDSAKSERQKSVRQRIKAMDEKEKYQRAIEDLKKTISQVQKAVKESQVDEQTKRQKIEGDLEKSLDEIREKIKTHEKESEEIQKQTVELKAKVQAAKAKLEALQLDADKKNNQKNEQIKEEKEALLERLKVLEKEAEQIGKVSQQYTQTEKSNFDNKLTIHIKTTRFPEYASSFESTARIINQCKEELFKAVSKLNEVKLRKQADKKKAEQFDKTFLNMLAQNDRLKEEIQSTKKTKQTVRSRILELQNQIKAKKEQAAG